MQQIKVENLSLVYDGRTVLHDLSFEVSKGDFLCIIGENGSGKSTLVKALLGLKSISSGSIKYGENTGKGKIGYLPQQHDIKRDFPAGVYETVLSGCLGKKGFHPFYTSADRKTADGAMKTLDIEALKSRSFRELSGGQQQRVLLARALCAASELIVLDEPATGLDPVATADMYEALKKINDGGTSVIMVSHDVPASLKYASHILHLCNHFQFFGTTAQYLESAASEEYRGCIEGDKHNA